MNTLKNHLILFDAECPMCNLYTSAFVKTGVLDSAGRAAYQQLPAAACPMVDRQRAVNEIALIDLESGEVTYGIKSLFKICAAIMPVFKRLFVFEPFIWIMSKVYAFISYNRRVIIPAPQTDISVLKPTFKLNYRIAYLVFTWLITSLILTRYAALLTHYVPIGTGYREYLICVGQIFCQGIVVSLVDGKKRWDYLGNMMTISLAGSLLLLPVIMLTKWLGQIPLIYTGYFVCVAGLMFLEHIRRSKLLQLNGILSGTWVCYRLIILILILLY